MMAGLFVKFHFYLLLLGWCGLECTIKKNESNRIVWIGIEWTNDDDGKGEVIEWTATTCSASQNPTHTFSMCANMRWYRSYIFREKTIIIDGRHVEVDNGHDIMINDRLSSIASR